MVQPTEDHFGVCDVCGKTDGCRNIGRVHWFFCAAHPRKWCVGSNLFSGWQSETENDWSRNQETLQDFVEIHRSFDEVVVELFANEFMRLQMHLCPGLVLDSNRGIPAWRKLHGLKFAAQILGIHLEFDAAINNAMAEHRAQGGSVSVLY